MELTWPELRKLLSYNKKEIVEIAEWFYHNRPDMIGRLAESVSENQMRSKEALFSTAVEKNIKPLVYNYEDNKIVIEIVGGWFGYPLLDYVQSYFKDYQVKIRFFELDKDAIEVCKQWQNIKNPDFDIKYYNMNWFDFKETRRAHVIINPSCEHMPDFKTLKEWFVDPHRTTFFITSNDKTDEPDHINCKMSATQFAIDNDIKVLHGESIKLKSFINKDEYTTYNRHIVIGRWN